MAASFPEVAVADSLGPGTGAARPRAASPDPRVPRSTFSPTSGDVQFA